MLLTVAAVAVLAYVKNKPVSLGTQILNTELIFVFFSFIVGEECNLWFEKDFYCEQITKRNKKINVVNIIILSLGIILAAFSLVVYLVLGIKGNYSNLWILLPMADFIVYMLMLLRKMKFERKNILLGQ